MGEKFDESRIFDEKRLPGAGEALVELQESVMGIIICSNDEGLEELRKREWMVQLIKNIADQVYELSREGISKEEAEKVIEKAAGYLGHNGHRNSSPVYKDGWSV